MKFNEEKNCLTVTVTLLNFCEMGTIRAILTKGENDIERKQFLHSSLTIRIN